MIIVVAPWSKDGAAREREIGDPLRRAVMLQVDDGRQRCEKNKKSGVFLQAKGSKPIFYMFMFDQRSSD